MQKVFVLAAAFAAAAVQAQTEWQLASGYGATAFQTENLVLFAQDVDRSTQGQLRIRVHPNNSLVRLADIPQAVQTAKVQAGETILSNMAADIPIAGADSVPFVVGSYEDAGRLWQLQKPLLEAKMAQRGLKLLYAVPWPPQGLYTMKPVQSASDFRHTRMRTWNQATLRIAQMLQATPVEVQMVDVNKALAERRIDSMITSAVTGVENQVWGHIRHYYEINAWFPKNVVFVNAAAFRALPPASREAVLTASQRAEERGWTLSRQAMQQATHELRGKGIEVGLLPAEFGRDLKRMGEKFSLEWIRVVGQEANAIFIPFYTRP